MANDSHQRAAEFHEMAAHAHRVASTHYASGDYKSGHELSRQAMEHSLKAHELSQEAWKQSQGSAAKKE
jgi:hypothetical protein